MGPLAGVVLGLGFLGLDGIVYFWGFGRVGGGDGDGTAETPEVVHARDGADKVTVGHVGQRGEMGLGSSSGGDAAAGLDPLAGTFGMWMRGGVYGVRTRVWWLAVYLIEWEMGVRRQRDLLFDISNRLEMNGPESSSPLCSFSARSVESPSSGKFCSSTSRTPSGIFHSSSTVLMPPLPSRTKLAVVVKMHFPLCLACTVRVMKLLPSRTLST